MILRRNVLFVLLLVTAPPAAAGEAPPALGAVDAWLAGIRTLESRFVQTLVSGALGTGLSESGRLWIERPGRMRWDYERPERKVAIVLGERTVLYLEEERQWIRGRLGEESGLLPALLAGEKPLSALFTASAETLRLGSTPQELRFQYSDSQVTVEKWLRFPQDGYLAEVGATVEAGGRALPARLVWGPGVGNPIDRDVLQPVRGGDPRGLRQGAGRGRGPRWPPHAT